MNKVRESLYEKEDLEDKHFLYEREQSKAKNRFYAPFVVQRKDIGHASALYSIKEQKELVYADNQIFS